MGSRLWIPDCSGWRQRSRSVRTTASEPWNWPGRQFQTTRKTTAIGSGWVRSSGLPANPARQSRTSAAQSNSMVKCRKLGSRSFSFWRGPNVKTMLRKAIRQAQVQLAGEQAPLAVASVSRRLGELPAARAQLRPFLAAHPNDVPSLRADASFALASGVVHDAEADLLAIISQKSEASDDAEWARRVLAIMLAASGNRQKSLESLQLVGLTHEGATYVPGDDEPIDDVRAKAKVLSLRNNRGAPVCNPCDPTCHRPRALQRRRPISPRRTYEADGNWSKAGERLQILLASNQQNALYLAHNTLILLRHGSIDDAESSLAKLERLEPASLRTLELKSRLLAARGQSGAICSAAQGLGRKSRRSDWVCC